MAIGILILPQTPAPIPYIPQPTSHTTFWNTMTSFSTRSCEIWEKLEADKQRVGVKDKHVGNNQNLCWAADAVSCATEYDLVGSSSAYPKRTFLLLL